MSTATAPASRRRLVVPAVLAAGALLFAACGDDDGDDETGSSPTTASAATEEASTEAFCEEYVTVSGLVFGEPPADEAAAAEAEAALQRLQDSAPDDIADDVDRLASAMEEMMGGGAPEGASDTTAGATDTTAATEGTMDMSEGTSDATAEGSGEGEAGGAPSPEFLEASAAVGVWAADECADEQLDVVAEDYLFEGIPAETEAGTYGIRFDNQGTEWHEIVLFRKNPGVTMTAEELLALPEEEVMTMVTPVGGAFAEPGGQSGTVVELTAGDHVALCFIPQGTVSLETEASGPPHFTQGMVEEFTVS